MKLSKILFLLWLLGFASLKAQQSQNYSEAYTQLNENFSAELLSPDQLAAFDQRAIQKIKDFTGYIEILTDSSYPADLKAHAQEMALGLFENEKVRVKEPSSGYGYAPPASSNIRDYLKRLASPSSTPVKARAASIQVLSPFVKKGKRYRGSYSYQQVVTACHNPSEQVVKQVVIEVAIQKIEKQFGENAKWVWEVKLGEVVGE